MKAIQARVMCPVFAALCTIIISPVQVHSQDAKTPDLPARDVASALAQLSAQMGLHLHKSENRTHSGSSGDLVSQNSVDGRFDLGTLVLQGELIPREIQDSPTSAYVERGDEIENRGETSIFGVLARTGNVTGGTNPTIRGINQSGSGRKTISTVVDGVRVSDDVNFGPISSWDLEQVEILRGPQSTQSGRNALAGTINVRSRDPIFDSEYRARLRYGHIDGTYDANASFSANEQLIDNRLAVRLSFDGRQSEGIVTNETPGISDFSELDETTLRLGLLWQPTDRLSATLKYSYVNGVSNPDQNQIDLDRFRETGDRVSPEIAKRETEISDDRFNLRLRYEFNDALSLESETTFWDRSVDVGNADASAGNTISRPNESIEQEIKFIYDTQILKAVGGLFYTDTTLDQTASGNLIEGVLDFANDFQRTTENYAVFGEVDYEMAPGLRLIAGARYDNETTKVTSGIFRFVSLDPATPAPPDSSGTVTEATYEAFLPKLGVFYDINENLGMGFVVQRGYRAGGAGITVPSNRPFEFDPEFTDTYELSFRSNFLEQSVFLNANLYYTEWKDQQVSVPDPESTNAFDTIITNAGRSDLWGGELELRARPAPAFELYSSIGYSQTEYKDFVFDGQQLAGNEFAGAPDWSGSIGGRYIFDNDVWIAVDATYEASSYLDVENTDRRPSLFLVNAQAGLEIEGWSLGIYVENLFDQEKIVSVNGETGVVTAGREIGLWVQTTF